MTITLTASEEAMFNDLKEDQESTEDSFHRIIAPMVAKHAEVRLQRLADTYRALSPDDQLEAIEVLKEWQASKQ
jgi:hypothetical protein